MSVTYHAGHKHLELARGFEGEKVALFDPVVTRIEVDSAHVKPRTRQQLCVDGADLLSKASIRTKRVKRDINWPVATSSTRSGGSLDFGRRPRLVSNWKTHLDVLWKLVERMLSND